MGEAKAGVASCLFAFLQYKQVQAKPVGKDIKHEFRLHK